MSVLRAAVLSRLAVLGLCLAAAAVVPPYDASGTLAPRCGASGSLVLRALAPLRSWDGAFFARVASRGYEHEKQHAFYPLAPAVARVLGGALHAAAPWVCAPACEALAAVLASQAAFCAAAVALHRLSRAVLGSEADARAAALLFCVSPASVFFSAAYSESLYAWLALAGCLALERGRLARGAAALAAAAAARSNGLALLGYPAYLALAGRARPWRAAAAAAAVAVPCVAVEAYARHRYCGGGGGAGAPPYCGAWLPAAYGHVQRRYWGVSLFGYYEARQAPNFALAAPALLLASAAVASYARADPCGRVRSAAGPRSSSLQRSRRAEPYVLHLAALLAVCATVLHVQVATRFLASHPAVYWHGAALVRRRPPGPGGRALVAWSLAYVCAGCALFSTFYPWT